MSAVVAPTTVPLSAEMIEGVAGVAAGAGNEYTHVAASTGH